MYEGLEKVPHDERAQIMSALVHNEQVAGGLKAWLFLFTVCLSIAVPVIYGTMLCYALLQRGVSSWLLLLRYGVAWISTTVVAVLATSYAAGILTDSVNYRFMWWHVAITCGCMIAFWLAMRRWSRERSTVGAVAAAD